jgi:hypothetical protein
MIIHPRNAVAAGAVSLILWLAPTVGLAEQGRCADCHLAGAALAARGPTGDRSTRATRELTRVPTNLFARLHLVDWEYSLHNRHGIGCDACHGGNPDTSDVFQAHRGMLNARNPASPIHPRNLPATCGRCHPGPFAAFKRSRHYELLRSGDDRVPNCAACHGEAAARLLPPRTLEAECARCHGAGRAVPRSDYPVEARLLHERVREVSGIFQATEPMLRQIADPARRARLEQAWRDARVPLREAIDAAHAFVFAKSEERLAEARRRAEAVLQGIVNPR